MWNRKALVVGIDDYSQNALHCCCNDSEAIKDLLSNHENGDPNFSVWKKDNIKTKSELKSLIINCFSGDEEVALFYYSGHGYIDSLGGYLVTPDFEMNDMGVSLQDILLIANKSKCKERIIILDSCYSGFMGNIDTSTQNTAVINEGVTILTACKKDECSIECNKHGIFTSLLIDALKGGAADITGNITVGNIYAFVDKALGPWEQRPVFKTNVTRFTSLRKVAPQVDLQTLRSIPDLFDLKDSEFHLDPSYEPTNTDQVEHNIIEPYADEDNVMKFNLLQKLESVGLVVPIGEEHMYFAAMNSKSCKLTTVGKQYWKLAKEKKI